MPTTTLTRESLRNLVVDAGAVYLNYGEDDERLLGATRGGNAFNVEQDIREIEVDGARGPIIGGRRVVEEHARITANLMEMSPENIKMQLFGAESVVEEGDTEDPDVEVITRNIATPGEEAYFKNVALLGTVSGTGEPAVFMLRNVIADGNFELSMEDQNEAATEVQFTAHFDPEALNESPWEIRFPVVEPLENG